MASKYTLKVDRFFVEEWIKFWVIHLNKWLKKSICCNSISNWGDDTKILHKYFCKYLVILIQVAKKLLLYYINSFWKTSKVCHIKLRDLFAHLKVGKKIEKKTPGMNGAPRFLSIQIFIFPFKWSGVSKNYYGIKLSRLPTCISKEF